VKIVVFRNHTIKKVPLNTKLLDTFGKRPSLVG
jgi:hypothetical protein